MIITKTYNIETKGWGDTKNLTPFAVDFLAETDVNEGILTVFAPGSTAGITTIEFEPGVVRDLAEVLEREVPRDAKYQHDEMWHDGNGFSHVRAALIGPSLTIPFVDKKLQLGTWQQIILLDFDNNQRNRKVIFQVMGE